MARTGPTNRRLKGLIAELRKKSREERAPIWEDVAGKLETPSRRRVEVNLSDIDRNANEMETVIVPGMVLSNGALSKPVTIAAWRFSESAVRKIGKSGSKGMSIEELIKANPKGSNARIMV